jgi:septal ring factor EnvC (AmiA/AmiB activator)
MTEQTQQKSEPWHLDKKVPIAFILCLLVQTFVFGGVHYVTQYRVTDAERRIEKLETFDSQQTITERSVADRLARIETSIASMKDALNRIDTSLERIARPERR